MISVSSIKKCSKRSNQITFKTNKKADSGPMLNPYYPFKGIDGNTYLIGYNDTLNNVTNCYAFVMGWQIKGKCGEDFVPGSISGLQYSLENLEELVRSDVETVGREVYEVVYDIPENLPDSEGYWIKALYCKERGYDAVHFMRKDKKSGRWIHKVGWMMPPKLVIRNVEFKKKIDAILESPMLQGVPKSMAESMLKMMCDESMYKGITVTKVAVEERDDAEYVSFTEGDEIDKYVPLWAMRISEP